MSKDEVSPDDVAIAAQQWLWCFTHDSSKTTAVWFGYGAIQITLDWDEFLEPYVWHDPPKSLTDAWLKGHWTKLACQAVGIEMKMMPDAIGFRVPSLGAESWLWRDDLIIWAAAKGRIPMMRAIRPPPRGREVVTVTTDEDGRVTSSSGKAKAKRK